MIQSHSEPSHPKNPPLVGGVVLVLVMGVGVGSEDGFEFEDDVELEFETLDTCVAGGVELELGAS